MLAEIARELNEENRNDFNRSGQNVCLRFDGQHTRTYKPREGLPQQGEEERGEEKGAGFHEKDERFA